MSASARRCLPLHFGSSEEPLFGWYHPPAPAPAPAPSCATRLCGVVLCNPIGDDYIRAHRALRHLAERLQRAGFPVLRFDFHGTGDSAGDERAPDRVRTWIDDIGRAVDELRARSGVGEICLAGLRLGATLAMAAAARRGDITTLVSWSAYRDGRAYVSETTRLHRMHKLLEPDSFAVEPSGWSAGGDEALGFLLTPETIDALERLDVTQLGRPAARALVIGPASDPAQASIADALTAARVGTTVAPIAGDRFLIMVPHHASLPTTTLDSIVAWLDRACPAVAEPRATRPPVTIASLRAPNGETPLFCGDGERLFGMLSRAPEAIAEPDRPAIILLSAGTVHRIGPHRFYVLLARRWARLGFAVLRLDLSGIGDSAAAPACAENLCYPPSAVDDVRAAMAALESAGVARRFILGGLCSGGDLTFQAALADRRAVGAIIMNPRTFCVHDLERVEREQRQRLAERAGGASGLGGVLGRVVANVRRIWPPRPLSPALDVPGCLRRLADDGVDTVLVASARDPGVEYVDRHFQSGMRALAEVPRFRRADFAGTDHTFTSLYAQELVAATLSDHLARSYR